MLYQHIDDFLDHLRVEKSASDLTIKSYRTDLSQFFNFLSEEYQTPVEDINSELVDHKTVRKYLIAMQNKGMSRATMARKLAALRSFVKYLCRENILINNPIASVATPKQDKRLPGFLYPAEIELLINAPDSSKGAGKRDLAILELLYAAGMRVSELVAIDLKDLDMDEEMLKLRGKGNKERIVPLGRKAKYALIDYIDNGRSIICQNKIKDTEALFLNRFGSRLSTRSIRNIINKYVNEVEINHKVNPHMLRHTFATELLNAGADLRSVQELLGHVKLSTTQIYTHLTIDKIKTVHKKTHPRG